MTPGVSRGRGGRCHCPRWEGWLSAGRCGTGSGAVLWPSPGRRVVREAARSWPGRPARAADPGEWTPSRRNTALEELLCSHGYTSGSLAVELNRVGEQVFGHSCRVTPRTVRRWFCGTVRYPAARHLSPSLMYSPGRGVAATPTRRNMRTVACRLPLTPGTHVSCWAAGVRARRRTARRSVAVSHPQQTTVRAPSHRPGTEHLVEVGPVGSWVTARADGAARSRGGQSVRSAASCGCGPCRPARTRSPPG